MESPGDVSRRAFLAASALAAAGAVAGCAREPAHPGTTVTTATYFTPSYADVLPSMTALMDAASKRAGRGNLSFDMFDSGTLLGADQLMPGLLLGVVDLMFTASSYLSSSYPILGAMELPFGTADYDDHARVTRSDQPLHVLINEELGKRGVRVLGSLPLSFGWIWTVDRPVRRPEDVAGLRIRTAGAIEGETIRAFGGAPVTMSSAEAYEALERGTIDGIMSYLGTVYSRDLQQIVKFGTQAHFGAYTIDAFCRTEWLERQDSGIR